MRFRRLTASDLPLLHGWLNEPGVVRWWEGEDVSWDAVVADHGPESDARVEHWLAVVPGAGESAGDDEPVGWIQCYEAIAFVDDPDGDEARAWFAAGAPADIIGIDYLVGDPSARGRGLGSRMIDAFVTDIVFGRHPHWHVVGASPFAGNVASWRALSNAGFVHTATLDDPDGPMNLMIRRRDLSGS